MYVVNTLINYGPDPESQRFHSVIRTDAWIHHFAPLRQADMDVEPYYKYPRLYLCIFALSSDRILRLPFLSFFSSKKCQEPILHLIHILRGSAEFFARSGLTRRAT